MDCILKDLSKTLQHIEWGEHIVECINDGRIYTVEIVFKDKKGDEVCKFKGRDEFGRKRIAIPKKVVLKYLKKRLHELYHEVTWITCKYVRERGASVKFKKGEFPELPKLPF